ncbi:exonuclease 1-like [Salvia splendens]|uniref:exonuclease 1-like n=1 Tax=Salvia splendens TaxID=180675 RepID=UPI001C275A15|nr:exonuclease 1-like [Salvia splendens]
MGIQGLLPLLKSIMNPIHIKDLEGCFVAVDTYSWLHKGALSCSTELCKAQPTSKHINYCMHRVNMLRHYGVKPILVFDGGPLPMKNEQEIKRARSRRENLSRAMEHESNGNLKAAFDCYQKAVDISPSIAYDLIQVLKQENIAYVVAPYEADAQMTFLAVSKHVEAVITEDSDLIAFGCPRIIYKMDKFGQGVEFKSAMLQHNKELNLEGFTQMMLLEMCILSGCDYLPSLPGMGLKKAHALMKKFKNHENVIKHLKYNSIDVTPLYEESFKKAILTFKHQRVYDPISDDIVHLSEPVGIADEDLDFLGPSLPQHVAKGIAEGDIDPITKDPIQIESGAAEKTLQATYQLKFFKPDGEREKIDLPVQKNILTNYFCFASLEAKRKFRAPRIVPNENNKTSSPSLGLHEEKHGSETDDLKVLGEHNPGPFSKRGVMGDKEMLPLTSLQNSVCKPCISLHKDLDSNQENRKATPGNKNVIVRSSYFMKKPNGETGKENESDVYNSGDNKLDTFASEKTCKTEEKRITLCSPYFRPSIKQNANGQTSNLFEKYFFQTRSSKLSDVDNDGESKKIVEYPKHRVRSSFFKETSVNENHLSKDKTISGIADESHNNSHQGLSTDDSLECTAKKRKLAQTDSPSDANDNNWRSGYSSDPEDEETPQEGKFGSDISHLGRYSNIAEKSMEKFVAVISSFRYSASGSRASGLRAPLKDIKNNFKRRRSIQ